MFGNSYYYHDDRARVIEVYEWLAAWDVPTGRMLWFRDGEPIRGVLAWSPDGTLIAFEWGKDFIRAAGCGQPGRAPVPDRPR